MNVIFLDVDGVLNSRFWNDTHQMEISKGRYIDIENVRALAELVRKTGSQIILHSGWRFWFDDNLAPTNEESQYLVNLLNNEGMVISGFTPDLTTEEIRKTKKFSKVKADEILTWLQKHPETENWVVLDDLDLHNDIVEKHQVRTDPECGLTEEDVEKSVKILN